MTAMIDEIRRKRESKGIAGDEKSKVKSQEVKRKSGSKLMTQKHCAHCKM